MADVLLERFASLRTEADVQHLIDERAAEGLHFEFKRKHDRAKPDLDSGDSWHFSRALSGFANSNGGILLWGVGTDKVDGLDRASAREPIVGHETFVARLRSSLLDAVIPTIDNVDIEPIPSADGRVGYAKCLIPRSEQTPHRAMVAGREYYKRSPEGFYRLEHFDLEDMFGRRPLPRLSLAVDIKEAGSSGGGGAERFRGHAVLTITNDGRGSARAPYLAIEIPDPYSLPQGGINGDGREGLTRHTTSDRHRFVFTSGDVVIHPGVRHEVTGINVFVDVQGSTNISLPRDLKVPYSLTSENSRLESGDVFVSAEAIAEAILPRGHHGFIPRRGAGVPHE